MKKEIKEQVQALTEKSRLVFIDDPASVTIEGVICSEELKKYDQLTVLVVAASQGYRITECQMCQEMFKANGVYVKAPYDLKRSLLSYRSQQRMTSGVCPTCQPAFKEKYVVTKP